MLLLVVFEFLPAVLKDRAEPRRPHSVLDSDQSLAEDPYQSKPSARCENGRGQGDKNWILQSIRFGLTGVQFVQPIGTSDIEHCVGPD